MVHLVLPRLSYPPVTYAMLLVSNNIPVLDPRSI
jgi:hypothetical protein